MAIGKHSLAFFSATLCPTDRFPEYAFRGHLAKPTAAVFAFANLWCTLWAGELRSVPGQSEHGVGNDNVIGDVNG